MLSKLAFRNVHRSIKDYYIYVLTITIIFSLLYAFNMVVFSKDIMELSEMLKNMLYAVIAVSIIIVFVTGWLVHYMNKFMLERRSKEFGTYMTLGISNKAIAKLFFAENVIMGFLCFVAGIIIGSFLYQIFTLIIMHIFEANYKIELSFSLKALGLTFLYVLLTYSFSMFRTKRKLKKMKIYDLLYAEKKNETYHWNHNKSYWFVFLISLIFGVLGTVYLNQIFDGVRLTLGMLGKIFLCYILCIYGCYLSLSSILLKIFIHNKNQKYKKDHLFLIRNITAKMNTMRITLGNLGLLLTITLTSLSSAILFNKFFYQQMELMFPFDIAISSPEEKDDFHEYKKYIENHFTIKSDARYSIYHSNSSTIYNLLQSTSLGGSYWDEDAVIKYSDYQKLRRMLGYKEISLEEGKFILHCVSGVKDTVKKEKNLSLDIAGRSLQIQECLTEAFSLQGVNGFYYVVVVPDEVAKDLEVNNTIYIVNTKETTTKEDYEELCKYVKPIVRENGTTFIPLGNVDVKGASLEENRSLFTIMIFSLFYLGIIFICVAATILAVQQLSDSIRYKNRYRILSQLGMQRKRMEGIILKQFIYYFGFPMVLPIFISLSVTISFNRLFEVYLDSSILLSSIVSSFGLFFFVYILYFIATYMGYRKSVFVVNNN